MSFSADGKYIYVINSTNNTLSIVGAKNNTPIKSINVGQYPISMSVNPNGKNIYVLNSNISARSYGGLQGKSTVSIINTSNYSINTITLNLPNSTSNTTISAEYMALSENGTKLYINGYYQYAPSYPSY